MMSHSDAGHPARLSQAPAAQKSETRVPPLSDALQLLMSLSEEDRQNLRILELIVLKDPAAVGRVVSLAESVAYGGASFSRTGRMRTVTEALRHLGTQTSFDALMAMWSVELFEVPPHLRALRGYVSRHIFAVCATMRRIAKHLQETSNLDMTQAVLLAILDKLGLAVSLTSETGLELPVLLEFSAGKRHLFHGCPELQFAFATSVVIAQSWGLPSSLQKGLAELADWEVRMPDLSMPAQLALAAEAMLDASAGLGNRALLEEPYRSWPVLRKLYDRQIDPMALVARF